MHMFTCNAKCTIYMPWIGCVHVWNGDMGGIVTKGHVPY